MHVLVLGRELELGLEPGLGLAQQIVLELEPGSSGLEGPEWLGQWEVG